MKPISPISIMTAAWVLTGFVALAPQARATGGVPLWTNRYDGPANGSDYGYGVAADANANVFVTGSSRDGSSADFTTSKYSSAGATLWTHRYNGPGNGSDSGFSVVVDTNGNVFVTGEATATNGYTDLVTFKYSNVGTPLWTNYYNGPGNREDAGARLVVDSSGNVFVAGRSSNGTNADFVTIKYSNAGVPQWTNRYVGPGNSTDAAAAVAVDVGGNVFVTGYSYGVASYYDVATLAYSSTGVALWTNRYTAAGFSDDKSSAVAVDTNGNVFVTGSSRPSGQDDVFLTIKYSSTGVLLWTRNYEGPPGGGDDSGYAMTLDGGGNVVVTGPSYDGSTWDYATIKYSNAGLPLWTNRYDGPGHGHDYSGAVAVDRSGNVFVTGSSDRGGFITDYATVAYSSAGVPLWTNRYEGPSDNNEASALTVDHRGDVIVTGSSAAGNGNYDWATLKYSSSVPADPHLDFQKLNNQLVLSWTNSSFHLQAAPLVSGTYTNLPGATNPYTNSFTGSQQYFRLQEN